MSKTEVYLLKFPIDGFVGVQGNRTFDIRRFLKFNTVEELEKHTNDYFESGLFSIWKMTMEQVEKNETEETTS